VKTGLTLTEFAVRRARLAGQSILEEGNPWFVPLDEMREAIDVQGGSLVSFANYDYLGLAGHERIIAAANEAVTKVGVGALGSRLVGGERKMHAAFEDAVARFIGHEACLTLVSGYLTNLSILPHLMGNRDLLLYDDLCHNSIVAGVRSAKALAIPFRHNDMEHLESLLREHRSGRRNCLIAVESLYSMDGDLPDLPGLLKLKDAYSSWLLVDEAHSFGVLGEHGRGVSEHFGEDPKRIDIIVGTLSKSLAACGGFLCASRIVIEWLKFTLSGFVYSVGLPPVITGAAHAALDVMIAEPHRIAQLKKNSERFLAKAREGGLNVGTAVGRAIVPVLFHDLPETMRASEALLANNVFAPPIVHIGVPRDAPRIRFFLSARHKPEDIDRTASVLAGLRTRHHTTASAGQHASSPEG
jgi:8-amino-7-oxononanoate synthase